MSGGLLMQAAIRTFLLTLLGGLGCATALWPTSTIKLFAVTVAFSSIAYVLVDIFRRTSPLGPLIVALSVTLLNAGGLAGVVPGGRYLPVAIVLISCFVFWKIDVSTFGVTHLLAAILTTLICVGSIYARIWSGYSDTAFPYVAALIFVCLSFSPRTEMYAERDMQRDTFLVSCMSAVVILAIGVAYSSEGVSISRAYINHEKGFLCALAVGTACLSGRKKIPTLMLSLFASIYAFREYPAGTYVVIMLVFVIVYAILAMTVNRSLRAIVCTAGAAGVLAIAFHTSALLPLSSRYFQLVGKGDNTETRLRITESALSQVSNVWCSRIFSGEISVWTELSGRQVKVPAHNDVVSMYLAGGLAAAVGYVSLFFLAIWFALDRLRWSNARTLVIVLGATLISGLVASIANPLVLNPSTALLIGVLMASILVFTGSARSRSTLLMDAHLDANSSVELGVGIRNLGSVGG